MSVLVLCFVHGTPQAIDKQSARVGFCAGYTTGYSKESARVGFCARYTTLPQAIGEQSARVVCCAGYTTGYRQTVSPSCVLCRVHYWLWANSRARYPCGGNVSPIKAVTLVWGTSPRAHSQRCSSIPLFHQVILHSFRPRHWYRFDIRVEGGGA